MTPDQLSAAQTADLAVQLALFAGILALVAAVALGALTMLLRLRTVRTERRSRRVAALWTLALVRAAAGRSSAPPATRSRDISQAMVLFNQYAETMTGEAHGRLAELGRRAGFEANALRLLEGSKRDRAVAIMTLGHVQAYGQWDRLAALVWTNHPAVWLEAARALGRLDAQGAVAIIARRLVTADDWHPAHLTRVLRLLPADLLAGSLAQHLDTLPARRIPAVLRLIDATGSAAALPQLRQLIAGASDVETIAGVLRVMAGVADPADAEVARSFLNHPHDGVRVQATTALGRFGLHIDSPLLAERLSDPAWWVRHRAAQALVDAGRVPRARLERFAETLPDPFARDALTAALATAGREHARAERRQAAS